MIYENRVFTIKHCPYCGVIHWFIHVQSRTDGLKRCCGRAQENSHFSQHITLFFLDHLQLQAVGSKISWSLLCLNVCELCCLVILLWPNWVSYFFFCKLIFRIIITVTSLHWCGTANKKEVKLGGIKWRNSWYQRITLLYAPARKPKISKMTWECIVQQCWWWMCV